MNIIDIADGQCVPGPGLYRMSMAHYHSQDVCPGPSISSTGIRKLALQSPHAFWKTSDLNPDRYPPKEIGDALILGRAAHALILEDEVFDEHFCYVPSDAPRRPTKTQIAAFERDGEWSDAAAEGAKYWEEFDAKAEGRLLLKEEQVQKILYMAENLRNTPEAVEALTGELTEICLIWQDAITGIWVKSRPDCLPSNGVDAGDLKTMAPKGNDLVLSAHRAITDMGYFIQMALVQDGMEALVLPSVSEFALIFTLTVEPYEVIPIRLDEDAVYCGRVFIRHGLDLFAHGLKTGEWPGRTKKFIKYSYPPTLQHRLGELQALGDLPNVERYPS